MAGATPRRGRDGTRTRTRIEAAALRLFATRGVDATSVRDIAEAVGVSEGALYRHFASKEELARALFLSRYAELAAAIGAIAAADAAFSDKIARLVAHACALFDTEPELFAYLLIHQHEHLAHVPDDPARNVVAAIAGLVATRPQMPGEMAPDLAAALALGLVVQPAVFTLYGRLPRPLGAQAPAITAAVLRLFEIG